MKRNLTYSALSLMLCCLAGSHADGAVLLAVDFGITTSVFVETGFTSFTLANSGNGTTPSQAIGSYTVTAYDLDAVGGRDRATPLDSGAFNQGDLMRDLLTRFQSGRGGSAAAPVVPPLPGLTIDGLSPNTSYVVDLWSLDFINNAGSVSTWYDMSSGSATQFGSQITNSTTVLPVSNSDYHTSGTILTDATGRFSLGASFTLGSGQLNGITVSTVPVPEPGSMAMVFSLGMLMTGRRRKY